MFFAEERIRKILEDLGQYTYSASEPVSSIRMTKGSGKGGEAIGLDTSAWSVFTPGDRWGGRDEHFWFRMPVKIPAGFADKTVVYEVKTGREGQWDATNPQFLAYVNGKVVQGLDVNHTHFLLADCAKAGEEYLVALHAYSGMNEGLVELNCRIAVLDKAVEKMYHDIRVPWEIARLLDKEDKRRIDILNYLTEAVNRLDLRKPFSDLFYSTLEQADTYLEKEFYASYCGCDDIVATSVGHTHIDVAWLWTLAQTREKTARSFSTVLNLMKQYPEYIFMSSQPQLYQYLKEDHPELYGEVRQRIQEGRWEAEGAMWLEADCNLSSGESLVRQVLFGTRFFQNEFGVRNRILWLPDVFGYSAALPQILKKCGIDYFMTTKISWNEYNKIPYDTFMWRGLDGTEILTHFISTSDYNSGSHFTTYNGDLVPKQVMGAWQRYQQKGLSNEVLISFGYGDGGGGPTKEMLENARRMEKGIPGCPRVKIGNSLDFFQRLEQRVSGSKRLPKWVGELYLEYHRGTYTSMARNKKYNRKCEFLYQDAEWLSSVNWLAAGNTGYPQEKLNDGWRTILLNQFHDILPGSSIKEVYEDSREQYEAITATGNQIVNTALGGVSGKIDLSSPSIVVFNQLGFVRSDIVECELPESYAPVEVYDAGDRLVPSQLAECTLPSGETVRKLLFHTEGIPAKGYKSFKLVKAAASSASSALIGADGRKAGNAFFDIGLDDNGHITSLYDKVNKREVLKAGTKGNVLQAFEDRPHNYDAWDINIYYQEKMWEIGEVESIQVVENGPVRSTLRIQRRFLDSVITQDICLYTSLPRIDFKTAIDWKEKHILLKTAFPVDVHTDKATYEIQYGNVERPTHWNTSWDMARFEVCAHKWADLSEDGYGVSLLNDCKYGHDIKDGVMRLTLLKSAASPNVDADREYHEFVYSLYPHAGGWKEAGTVPMAYALNCPLYAVIEEPHAGTLPAELSFVSIDRENVVIEVVKKAEDSDELVVRLYECYNRRTEATLTFFKDPAGAFECDLLEKDIAPLEVTGKAFTFTIMPYEIKTFKVKFK